MTIRQALLMMGYRECKPGWWLKPIGYQLFSYHENKNVWTNWFKGADGPLGRYDIQSFQADTLQFDEYSGVSYNIKPGVELCVNVPNKFARINFDNSVANLGNIRTFLVDNNFDIKSIKIGYKLNEFSRIILTCLEWTDRK